MVTVTVTGTGCRFKPKERINLDPVRNNERINDERASLLYSAWSSLLTESAGTKQVLKLGLDRSSLPNAPHLEKCKLKVPVNKRLDNRDGMETFPPWTSWKGMLKMYPSAATNEGFSYFNRQATSEGAYPPWVCF